MSNKLLFFFFDGTWEGREDPDPTNIRRLYNGAELMPDATSFYFAGPGDQERSNWFGAIFGGMFGWGVGAITNEALELSAANYAPGAEIAVFGFSRGAAAARMFCAALPHSVAFLGCFDTVGAFAPFGRMQQGTRFHDLHVAKNVRVAAHAVAIHEDRRTFRPNLMNRRSGVTEVWFRGVHGDVGGGEPQRALSDTTLVWMRYRAAAAGIDIPLGPTQPDMDATPTTVGGWWRRARRRVGVKVNDQWVESPTANIYGEDHDRYCK